MTPGGPSSSVRTTCLVIVLGIALAACGSSTLPPGTSAPSSTAPSASPSAASAAGASASAVPSARPSPAASAKVDAARSFLALLMSPGFAAEATITGQLTVDSASFPISGTSAFRGPDNRQSISVAIPGAPQTSESITTGGDLVRQVEGRLVGRAGQAGGRGGRWRPGLGDALDPRRHRLGHRNPAWPGVASSRAPGSRLDPDVRDRGDRTATGRRRGDGRLLRQGRRNTGRHGHRGDVDPGRMGRRPWPRRWPSTTRSPTSGAGSRSPRPNRCGRRSPPSGSAIRSRIPRTGRPTRAQARRSPTSSSVPTRPACTSTDTRRKGATLNQVTSGYLAELKRTSKAKVTSNTATSVDGLRARRVEWSATFDGTRVWEIDTLVVRGKQAYYIGYATLAKPTATIGPWSRT